MKKTLLLSFLLISFISKAQDTTIIQTLTFDSTGRSYVFDFPVDVEQSYEKIIMEYRIRCKGGQVSTGSNTNLGCGEWDYSCNTYIIDSNYTDSAAATHANYVISGFSGTTFAYTIDPTYNYYQSIQQEVIYSDTSSEISAIVGSGTNSSAYPFNNATGQAKVQYLILADELIDGGIAAGNLTGLRISVDALGDELNNLRIKLKETSATQLNPQYPDVDGFYSVYYLNTAFQAVGSHQFNFNTYFDWDGTSNIIVEFSFDQSPGNSSNVLSESNTDFGIASTTSDYSIQFDGIESIDVENSFPTIQNEVTISFWAYGDSELIPIHTTICEGLDNNNNRQVNIHLPWGNSRVYWDCGNDGSGYDRIDKEAAASELEGQWNHWAFTKNATTGTMKIYLNGVLWHTGTGKNKPIDIQSMHIGSTVNMVRGYYGNIDEFRIWDTQLSAAEIADYMYSTIPSNHPSIDHLVAYYNFNEGNGIDVIDQTGNHPAALINNPLWRIKRGNKLFMDFISINERPNMEVLQGEYTSTTTDFVIIDELINAPNKIEEYSVTGNDLNLDTTYYYYEAGNMPVYNEAGEIIDSVFVFADGSLSIIELDYYQKFPSRFEIMSFVTPYGINLDMGMNGKMWQFDVTDFAPVLKDSKQLSVEFGKWQEEMDIRFLFISGTPPRDVMNIQQVWRAGVQQPYAKILSDAVFEPRNILLDPLASSFKINAAVTGHGQQGEFISRTHFIKINGGDSEYSWQAWKECADNPIFPQGGTWIYDRAGWCPGAPTDLEEFELSNSAGETIEIDYGLVSASGTSNYLVSVQLVTYGEANFNLDAGIVEVQRPSNRIEYDRVNPICYDPIIIIRNTGATILTELTITYNVDGGTEEVFIWTGNLASMEKEEVILPIGDESFWAGNGNDVFNVTISAPNGGTDEYANNNTVATPFTLPVVYNEVFLIKLRTNNYPNQNSYRVKDVDGNIVFSKDGFEANTTYRDTLYLDEGCYLFELDDTGDNGLYFWANTGQGSGYVKFIDASDGGTIQNFESDFGKNIRHSFTVGNAVSVETIENEALFDVYPNPTKDQFSVDVELINTSDIKIIVHDISGRVIESRELSGFKDGTITFDLKDQSNGVYYCTLISDDNKQTKMIVLNK